MNDHELTDYLTDTEKRRIAEQVVRERVTEALRDERQVTNLIYTVAQEQVTQTLESEVGAGWRKRLIVKAAEAINGTGLDFHIFRRRDRWGTEDGPGVAPLKLAVECHTDRIEQRVMEAIDRTDDDALGDLLRHALTSRLGGTP